MADEEIEKLIDRIKEMARRIGCDFIPDTVKLETFRGAREACRFPSCDLANCRCELSASPSPS